MAIGAPILKGYDQRPLAALASSCRCNRNPPGQVPFVGLTLEVPMSRMITGERVEGCLV